jgi:protein-disulfide isomerase
MSEPKPDSKSSNKWIIIVVVLLLILGGAYYASLAPQGEPVDGGLPAAEEQISAEGEALEEIEEAVDIVEFPEYCNDEAQKLNEDGTLKEECSESLESEESGMDASEAAEASAAGFDLSKAKTERVLGDRSAPIRISEHSSFSCGHCGNFHKNVFKTFKAEYVDTGKAYIVFSDFPLNAPALHATKVSRCVADDQYFDFVQELFERQEEWAYETNYLEFLKDRAESYGVDEDTFNACLGSEELQEALLKRMQAVQKQFNVRATPTFVVNNQKTISGTASYEEFKKAIEAALAEIEAETTQ